MKTEIEILELLSKNHHENIAQLVDYFIKKGKVHLCTEHGGNDLHYVFTTQVIPAAGLDFIMKQLASALIHLKSLYIIHGDIKIENIVVFSDKHSDFNIKLIDWDSSMILDRENNVISNSETNYVGGTVFYVPPELYMERRAGYFNDVWNCGVVYFVLITCLFPFQQDTVIGTIQDICLIDIEYAYYENISPERVDIFKKIFVEWESRITCDELYKLF